MSTMETLDCVIHKVMFNKPSKFNAAGLPYVIARTGAGHTIKGEMRKIVEYERYRFWGEWRLQKPFGSRPSETAFEFSHHEVLIDESSVSGIVQYLSRHVDGLGLVRSSAIVEEFGTETLGILRTEPERAGAAKGVTPAIIESIREHFASTKFDPRAYADLIDLFSDHKIPVRIVRQLCKDWGSDAPQVVKERPYLLLAFPGMGWKTVDSLATSKKIGYPADGVSRHASAIAEAMEQISQQGHTYASRVDIESIAFQLIQARPRDEAWDQLLSERELVECYLGQETEKSDRVYALPKIATAETTIADRLALLARSAMPLPFSLSAAGLNSEQADGLALIEKHGVVILCGPPGAGKTYTVTQAISGLVNNGFTGVRFVAPTGKAAKNSLIARFLGTRSSAARSTGRSPQSRAPNPRESRASRPNMVGAGTSSASPKLHRIRLMIK
jgi:exodeoxyribonuclease V alpha subunit